MSKVVGWFALMFMLGGLLSGCAAAPASPQGAKGGASITAGGPSEMPTSSAADQAATSRPTTEQVVAAAKRLILEKDAGVRAESIANVKIVRDRRGRWWASAVGVPAASAKLEEVNVYLYRQGGIWLLFDLGTGIDASELPTDVRDGL